MTKSAAGVGKSESEKPKSSASSDDLLALREEWRVLYAETLPAAARAKAPEQSKWCVFIEDASR